jgi:LPP20 lipoprotein
MSSNSARVGILLVLCALTSCTASTNTERATVPPPSGRQESGKDFLSDTRQQYPSDLYLTGIGEGTSERAATELARADLLKKVRAEVRVTWTDLMLERSGRTEQEVSRLVETRVTELVKGIEVVNQWRDSRTGEAYCVVALAKTEVSKILKASQGQRVARESPEVSPVLSDGIWFTAEGRVLLGDDATIAEARTSSRDEARRKAIEQALGVFVRASTVVYNFGLAEDLVHSIVRGVVIEEQILSEGLREVDIGRGQKALIHDTTLSALIRPVPAERRNNFAIKGNLNKSIFFANEEMVITVAASTFTFLMWNRTMLSPFCFPTSSGVIIS